MYVAVFLAVILPDRQDHVSSLIFTGRCFILYIDTCACMFDAAIMTIVLSVKSINVREPHMKSILYALLSIMLCSTVHAQPESGERLVVTASFSKPDVIEYGEIALSAIDIETAVFTIEVLSGDFRRFYVLLVDGSGESEVLIEDSGERTYRILHLKDWDDIDPAGDWRLRYYANLHDPEFTGVYNPAAMRVTVFEPYYEGTAGRGKDGVSVPMALPYPSFLHCDMGYLENIEGTYRNTMFYIVDPATDEEYGAVSVKYDKFFEIHRIRSYLEKCIEDNDLSGKRDSLLVAVHLNGDLDDSGYKRVSADVVFKTSTAEERAEKEKAEKSTSRRAWLAALIPVILGYGFTRLVYPLLVRVKMMPNLLVIVLGVFAFFYFMKYAFLVKDLPIVNHFIAGGSKLPINLGTLAAGWFFVLHPMILDTRFNRCPECRFYGTAVDRGSDTDVTTYVTKWKWSDGRTTTDYDTEEDTEEFRQCPECGNRWSVYYVESGLISRLFSPGMYHLYRLIGLTK